MVYLLESGTGFVFQTLLADLLVFGGLGYVWFAIIYPYMRKIHGFEKQAKSVGGPKPHWLLGDLNTYGFDGKGLLNSVERCKEFPAMCSFYVGRFHARVQLYHPDVMKTALTCTIRKGKTYEEMISMVIREGLVVSKGALWKRHRRLLNTMFHTDILKEQCLIFNKNCESMFQSLDQVADTQTTVDISESFAQMAYWNMMESVMSQNNETGESSPFCSVVNSLSKLAIQRQQNPLHWTDAVYYRTRNGKKLVKQRHYLWQECLRIIKERKDILNSLGESDGNAENKYSSITDEKTGKVFTFRKRKGKPVDFLDLLLQTKDQDGVGLSDGEITNEVITFFAAGMETVATGLSWAAYLLSINPECQAKCREEIKNALGDKEICEMSDLPKLQYLGQCTKEALRLYPSIPIIGRFLPEDTVFSHRFNDYKEITLKKGTTVTINLFAAHRNPHVWENPNVFDPDRFSPENSEKIPLYAYSPFAAGPRNCIGQRFGMNQTKVILAQLLRRYELHWDPNVKHPSLSVGVSMKPGGGVPVLVRRVK